MNDRVISTDKSKLDIALIHDYIAKSSYWGKGRTLKQMTTAIDHSLCFGLYQGGAQIGFARVVTDTVSIAYLADVFILKPYQNQGLGQLLLQQVINHPDLQSVSWMLRTQDAHSLYQKFGFSQLQPDSSFMRKS